MKKKDQGITLIALIITIIILIILAMVAINAIYEFRIVDIAVNGAGDYANAAKHENEVMDETTEFLDVATNKKPRFEKIESVIGESTVTIKVIATDEDDKTLTYQLYTGTSQENIAKYGEEIKKDQGEEVSFTIPKTNGAECYYKIEVKDRFVTINTGIKKINVAPKVTNVAFVSKTTNSIKVKALATDEENDKLTYILKVWKKIDETVNEEELIKEEPTKTVKKENITAGIEQEIEVAGLEEYTDYVYRIDVSDELGEGKSSVNKERTYCSGKGLECDGR